MTTDGGFFDRAARWSARKTGRGVALSAILLWALAGPLFGFSDTWQLAINTATTIITFLMVFLIQNAQTRDAEALQIKVDELIRAQRNAHNALLDLEELSEPELAQIKSNYERLARRARRHHGKRAPMR